ncbi:UNVERIFIED_CONTAM: hypothetical protein NCL1_58635 [Trichonephila clavipes]
MLFIAHWNLIVLWNINWFVAFTQSSDLKIHFKAFSRSHSLIVHLCIHTKEKDSYFGNMEQDFQAKWGFKKRFILHMPIENLMFIKYF